MYDIEDEWEHGEKRAQAQAMIEELVLDGIIAALTKIKQRNEWVNRELKQSQEEIKF